MDASIPSFDDSFVISGGTFIPDEPALYIILEYGYFVSRMLARREPAWKLDLPAHISQRISEITSWSVGREALLRLRGTEAQHMVDVMQLWLRLRTGQYLVRGRIISTLLKLSAASGALPQEMFIRGVDIGHDRDPWASGGFADVFRGKHNGLEVAIKRLRVFSEDRAKVNAMLCEEALLWRQLDHPYILPFLGIDAETFASRDALSLVSPWMELGTLKKYISSSSYNTARCGVRLLFETAQGIQYLHEQQLVHGDINWVNVFVDGQGSAKIADFGLARICEVTTGGPTATLSGPKGTIGWMSPERINTSLRLAPPTDVYSFGVLCYVMWTRERPFSNMNDFKVVMHVSGGGRLERPSSQECHGEAFPDVLWDLVCHCWGQTAGTRPRMSTIVASFESWIRGTVETSDIHRSEGADLDVDRRAAHSI